MKVNIQDIVDAIENADPDLPLYLKTETMQVVSSEDEGVDWEEDTLIELPDQRAINDYGCMEQFIEQKTDGEAKEWLSNAIRGRGAFRMFRATLNRFDLTQQWYDFRDRAHLLLAMDWCDENGVEYESDCCLPVEDEENDEYEKDYEEEERMVPYVTIERPLTFVEITNDNRQNLIYLIATYMSEKSGKPEDLDRAEEQIDAWMNMDSVLFTAVEHGRWVGFIMALFDPEGTAHVQHVFVRKECRKKGYGRALLERLNEKVQVVGNGHMDIDLAMDQENAKGFVLALGYGVVVRTRYGKCEDSNAD